jgi:RHS repeat-associated protein
VLTYTFDRAERPTGVFVNGDRIKKYEYYPSNDDSCNAGSARGKLWKATRTNRVPDPNQTSNTIAIDIQTVLRYNGGMGRVSETTVSSSTGPSFHTGFQYDGGGNNVGIDYPACTTCGAASITRHVTNTFAYGLLTAVAGFASDIDYAPNGLVTKVAHSNGVSDVQVPDGSGLPRPKTIYTTGIANGNWNEGWVEYRYDGSGNVYQSFDQQFWYDAVGRLAKSCVGGLRQEYVYDRWGNQTAVTLYNKCTADGVVTGGRSTGASAASNRLTAASYDAAGNITVLGGYTYAYDGLNQITHAQKPISGPSGPGTVSALGKIFLYDASGERIAILNYRHRTASGYKVQETWTPRDLSNRVLRDYVKTDGSWAWSTDYIYRGSALLATVEPLAPPANITHYHLDHLGSTRVRTNNNASRYPLHTYEPFGAEITTPESDTHRMRFTGHERDNNNTTTDQQAGDLDYMHARYYSPLSARFLSVDPLLGNVQDPQSWNRYSYVRNTPLNATDPTGMRPYYGAPNVWASLAPEPAPTRQQMIEARFGKVRPHIPPGCILCSGGRARPPSPQAQELAAVQRKAEAAGGINPPGKTSAAVQVLIDQKTGMAYPQLPPTDVEAEVGIFFTGIGEGGFHGSLVKALSRVIHGKRLYDLVDRDSDTYAAGEFLGAVIDFVVGAKHGDDVAKWVDKVFPSPP